MCRGFYTLVLFIHNTYVYVHTHTYMQPEVELMYIMCAVGYRLWDITNSSHTTGFKCKVIILSL